MAGQQQPGVAQRGSGGSPLACAIHVLANGGVGCLCLCSIVSVPYRAGMFQRLLSAEYSTSACTLPKQS